MKHTLKFKGNWSLEKFEDKGEISIILKKRLNKESKESAQELINEM